MKIEKVTIDTEDGLCPAGIFAPDGSERHPAVIFFMDGFGIRPTLEAMAGRIASRGYVVLLPDLYYRAGAYAPLRPADIFASGDIEGSLGHLLSSIDNRRAARDAGAFIRYLSGRTDFSGPQIGVTGYCMGGGMALSAAAAHPDAVAAAASFHGGYLATDAEDSPHRGAPAIKAEVYVAGADDDPYYPPEMAQRLAAALTAAGVEHRCEIYPGALHGFTMTDFPVFDEAASDRHWRELLALFDRRLRKA